MAIYLANLLADVSTGFFMPEIYSFLRHLLPHQKTEFKTKRIEKGPKPLNQYKLIA
jgi:hypothetical protein